MRKVVGFLSAIALVVLIWIGIWICRVYAPWLPPGSAVHLSSEHIGNYDFQVWQRKNVGSEPFATGLFAHSQGGPWQVFLLDFQDSYRSSIVLRAEGSGVAVLQDNRRLGVFDETQGVLRRESDGSVSPGSVLNTEPPGNWWLEESRKW